MYQMDVDLWSFQKQRTPKTQVYLRPENKDPRKIVGKHPKTGPENVEDPQKRRPPDFFPLTVDS